MLLRLKDGRAVAGPCDLHRLEGLQAEGRGWGGSAFRGALELGGKSAEELSLFFIKETLAPNQAAKSSRMVTCRAAPGSQTLRKLYQMALPLRHSGLRVLVRGHLFLPCHPRVTAAPLRPHCERPSCPPGSAVI